MQSNHNSLGDVSCIHGKVREEHRVVRRGLVEEGVVQDQQPAQLCTPAPLLLLVVP